MSDKIRYFRYLILKPQKIIENKIRFCRLLILKNKKKGNKK